MKRYVVGQDRSQSTLFPEVLDDYIAEDNPVRVVDVFVDELDLKDLGFEGAEPEVTGRPSYHPATLLKLYIYGYLNRLQSSRRLERETQRNVELIWLTGRLCPDFKTIADFRRDNGNATRRDGRFDFSLGRGKRELGPHADEQMRVLVHREHGHPVSGVIGQMKATVGIANRVGERTAAGDDRHTRVDRRLDDGSQCGREQIRVREQASPDLEDGIDQPGNRATPRFVVCAPLRKRFARTSLMSLEQQGNSSRRCTPRPVGTEGVGELNDR